MMENSHRVVSLTAQDISNTRSKYFIKIVTYPRREIRNNIELQYV